MTSGAERNKGASNAPGLDPTQCEGQVFREARNKQQSHGSKKYQPKKRRVPVDNRTVRRTNRSARAQL
jgi:hypothetical protein